MPTSRLKITSDPGSPHKIAMSREYDRSDHDNIVNDQLSIACDILKNSILDSIVPVYSDTRGASIVFKSIKSDCVSAKLILDLAPTSSAYALSNAEQAAIMVYSDLGTEVTYV